MLSTPYGSYLICLGVRARRLALSHGCFGRGRRCRVILRGIPELLPALAHVEVAHVGPVRVHLSAQPRMMRVSVVGTFACEWTFIACEGAFRKDNNGDLTPKIYCTICTDLNGTEPGLWLFKVGDIRDTL